MVASSLDYIDETYIFL